MLKLLDDLDVGHRVDCMLAGWPAYDPVNKFYLRAPTGRKAGRMSRYYLCRSGGFQPVEILADSDAEAAKRANDWLVKIVGEICR